jgi:peptide-methionine (S)-S-oxide reductase
MKNTIAILAALTVLVLLALANRPAAQAAAQANQAQKPGRQLAKATFAGGCFWCMEPPFDKLDGVVSTTSGYTGGSKKNPTYEEVSSGGTGHTESVQIVYDPSKVSYAKLLEVYWHNVDPTVANRQFCDVGEQYRTAIFYHGAEQKRLAEETRTEVQKKLGKTVQTEIAAASTFYPAEDYHQDYYEKNPIRYKFYRSGCGRDARLKEIWGEAAGH